MESWVGLEQKPLPPLSEGQGEANIRCPILKMLIWHCGIQLGFSAAHFSPTVQVSNQSGQSNILLLWKLKWLLFFFFFFGNICLLILSLWLKGSSLSWVAVLSIHLHNKLFYGTLRFWKLACIHFQTCTFSTLTKAECWLSFTSRFLRLLT